MSVRSSRILNSTKSMKSLFHHWIFLFLVNWCWCTSLVHSRQEIKLQNWIETAPGKWPPANTPQEQFGVYHSEGSPTKPLTLSSPSIMIEGLKSTDTVGLSFKYWTSSDASIRIRSSENQTSHEIKLIKGGTSWHSSEEAPFGTLTNLKNISIEEWSSLAFISQEEVFTLALKDIRIYYTRNNEALDWINCLPNCGDLFGYELATSSLVPAPGRYVPFQLDTGLVQELTFVRKNGSTSEDDFCVDFTYVAKKYAHLEVKYGELMYGIFFPISPENFNSSNLQRTYIPQRGSVCASWLTPDVASVEALVLRYSVGYSVTDLDNNYVSDVEVRSIESSDHNTTTTLSEGIYAVNHLELKSHFNTNNDKVSDDGWSTTAGSLIFTKSLDELKSLQANSGEDFNHYYLSSLRSKWIPAPNHTASTHIQIGYDVDEKKTKNMEHFISEFKVEFISSANFQTLYTLYDSNVRSVNLVLPIDPDYRSNFYTFIQVRIVVQLNVGEIRQFVNEGKLTGPLELLLENFSVNDPCVGEKMGLETCSNNEKNGHGSNGTVNRSRCVRDYAKFTGNCECSGGFYGDRCQFDSNFVAPTVPTPVSTRVLTPVPIE